jgi:hypothetical protein
MLHSLSPILLVTPLVHPQTAPRNAIFQDARASKIIVELMYDQGLDKVLANEDGMPSNVGMWERRFLIVVNLESGRREDGGFLRVSAN